MDLASVLGAGAAVLWLSLVAVSLAGAHLRRLALPLSFLALFGVAGAFAWKLRDYARHCSTCDGESMLFGYFLAVGVLALITFVYVVGLPEDA